MIEKNSKPTQVNELIHVAPQRGAMTSFPEPLVYTGTMMESVGEGDGRLRNRRGIRRKTSPFNIMLILLGSAVLIVLYISNVIKVTQLLGEINRMETRHRRILMEQELLRAQVNRMSSLERVRKIGEEQLELKNPETPPVWIKVDQEKVRAVEEASKEKWEQ